MELGVRHKLNSRLFTIYGALEINFYYLSPVSDPEFTELDLLVQNFVPCRGQTVFAAWFLPSSALAWVFTPPPILFCHISFMYTTRGT